jgi:hypothetical protein
MPYRAVLFIVGLFSYAVGLSVAEAEHVTDKQQSPPRTRSRAEANNHPSIRLPKLDNADELEIIDTSKYIATREELHTFKSALEEEFKANPCTDPNQEFRRACRYRRILTNPRYRQSPFDTLDPAEVFVLTEYTQYAYREINDALRKNDLGNLQRLNPTIRMMISTLNKLPRYRTNNGKVHRILGGFAERIENEQTHQNNARVLYETLFTVGETFQDLAFMSTSAPTSPYFQHLVEKKAALLVIINKSHSGRMISQISGKPVEEEVLFPPGTKFRVIKKEEIKATNGKPLLRVVLEEE